MNAMDISQISELAAIMDSWAPASGSQIITNSQALGVQSQEPINKTLVNVVKQEDASVSREYNFPGIVPISAALQGYVPGHIVNQTSPEQVPMDDFDPLEAFTFWDGENFYCHQDFEACAAANACEMQTDSTMPPLPEYIAEDDITRDDVFPIKDPDFLHNPTLAELNSCGENLFDYSVEHNFLTEDNSFPLLADGLSKTFPSSDSHFVASPVSSSIANSSFVSGMNYAPSGFIDVKPNIQHALSSSCPIPSRLMPNSQYFGAGEEKFLMCPQNSPASDSFYMQKLDPIESKSQLSVNSCSVTPVHATPSRLQESNLLSSSAPPDVTMTSFFPKVKTEPPSHSPGPKSITERSLSGFSSLSLSNDDESGSFFDDDTDHDDDDDFSSDEDVYQYESDEILSTSWPSGKDEKSCQHRKHRYFWQYNLQSRGAKTQNILPRKDSIDPYVLNDAFDPVFSEECALPVKHSGKARRGDGNDLTPNPCKLFNIGIELKKLNKLIYNTHPHESGSQGKPLSRKEKNKLASRVCRLKKKAQHEANKIKLYGLQQEHKKLLTILMDTRELLRYKIENPHDRKLSNCSKKLESFLAANEPYKVAGNTAAFVNEVLDKVAKGECDGGLGQL